MLMGDLNEEASRLAVGMYIYGYTVCDEPRAGFIARDGARGHDPRKGKWTYVVVVGEGGVAV